ncbi:hypothetical protein LJR267_002711 [Paraburkholderia hospita]|jgi:hypothetical protein|uniref:lipid-binding SYLF domain-containing protein n=1 Tax=Paraburkholderia hospita TaxID=169430 RepID=UPI003ECFB8FC
MNRRDPEEAAIKRHEIDAGVDGAINKLHSSTPGAQAQGSKAKGILVFPSVFAAGLVVGGEYGEGALREGGTSVGYYKTSTASFGLQIGAQSKAVIHARCPAFACPEFIERVLGHEHQFRCVKIQKLKVLRGHFALPDTPPSRCRPFSKAAFLNERH